MSTYDARSSGGSTITERHAVRRFPDLRPGDRVVNRRAETPRSYRVQTDSGEPTGNRRAPVHASHSSPLSEDATELSFPVSVQEQDQMTPEPQSAPVRLSSQPSPVVTGAPETLSTASGPPQARGRQARTVTRSGRQVFVPRRYCCNSD